MTKRYTLRQVLADPEFFSSKILTIQGQVIQTIALQKNSMVSIKCKGFHSLDLPLDTMVDGYDWKEFYDRRS